MTDIPFALLAVIAPGEPHHALLALGFCVCLIGAVVFGLALKRGKK